MLKLKFCDWSKSIKMDFYFRDFAMIVITARPPAFIVKNKSSDEKLIIECVWSNYTLTPCMHAGLESGTVEVSLPKRVSAGHTLTSLPLHCALWGQTTPTVSTHHTPSHYICLSACTYVPCRKLMLSAKDC